MFAKQDLENLAKIGVFSILDLALILPKSFDDLSVCDEANEGENTVEVEILSRRRNGAMMIMEAFCHTWEIKIKIIIFNAKSWHYGAFKQDKKIFIHGKSNFAFGSWQFVNPIIVTKTGEIKPHYKTILQDTTVTKLIKKYINDENLKKAGLNSDERNAILSLHEISKNSVQLLGELENNETLIKILKFVEILNYLQKLSTKKINFPSLCYEIYDISSWLKTLPFKPTNDQINAINDIKNDLESKIASRRVVMGDVGSGKTLIILASVLMNYPQISYLMAPTTILCEQIYEQALALLPKFMKILYIKSGEKTPNFDGVHFVIGTHALLYHDLKPSNLIMIDEQHRFGSNQREKINQLTIQGKYRANFIQFSATPIPRTLSLIQSELVKFSFLKQIPYKKEISTIVLQNSGFDEFMSYLKDEISNKRQAIIVYPLVEQSERSNYQSLDEAAPFWQTRFKNVYITHGKDKNKEEIIAKFRENGDLLLTTTVVEVGISLPRLSTILIVGAEKMGLASLHQLRGRVGRNGGKGRCYLYTKLKQPPNRLFEFANTLDGFKVAQLDLQNRQGGDLLDGFVQHGSTFKWFKYEEDITENAKFRLENLQILNQ